MAHSLELRSPLLDHEVLALGLALPDELKLQRARGQAGAAARVRRPPAAGGRRPRQGGLRRPARALVPRRPARARRRRAARPTTASSAASRSSACSPSTPTGAADHGHRLWCLVMLALWQRAYLDAPVPALKRPARLLADPARGRRPAPDRPARTSAARSPPRSPTRATTSPVTFVAHRHLRLHPGPAVGVHAAALRLLPDPDLLDPRPPLALDRARADRGRARRRVARLRDRQTDRRRAGRPSSPRC